MIGEDQEAMTEKVLTILSINPGSTSTKIAVYENKKEIFRKTMEHSAEEIAQYKSMVDQFPMRKKAIMACLQEANFPVAKLSAVAGRGGKLPPLKQGAYLVNKDMIDFLTYRPIDDHASNLGAIIAYDIAAPLNIPAYIYDAVVVDELEEIARLTGVPEMTRRASCHVLNMRAVALKTAQKMNRNFQDMNFVVTHMGGGITATVISGGKMIDVLTDEEGAFSPERAGRVPCRQLVNLCFSDQHNCDSAIKRMRGKGGLVAYLGTNKALEVEEQIEKGDEYAQLIYQGMAYQAAKGIGELATVVKGKVDVIIITGAIAYSKMVTNWITERVQFIAPVEIIPGENELESLAFGVLRVLNGEEIDHEFVAPE
ncbi:MAG: buk2 2 [Firmicutes bacterium]|nr:buk2 2 [Bacillota bacterium]